MKKSVPENRSRGFDSRTSFFFCTFSKSNGLSSEHETRAVVVLLLLCREYSVNEEQCFARFPFENLNQW